MRDMLYAVLALISAAIAGVSFYMYTNSGDNKMYLVLTIVFVVALLITGGLFLSGRVNKGEDIHITD